MKRWSFGNHPVGPSQEDIAVGSDQVVALVAINVGKLAVYISSDGTAGLTHVKDVILSLRRI